MKRVFLCLVLLVSLSFVVAGGDFEVDSALLKMVVKEGESVSKGLKITSEVGGDFSVDKNGLDFVFVEELFSLDSRGERVLELEFSSEGLEPGIYFGEILISSGKMIVVPIIFEVESREVFFDSSISVPLEYSRVYVGGNLVVENRIINLENIGIRNIDVHYFVEDFDGNSLFSEDENIAVESQVLNTKMVSISEDVEPGDYLFGVVLKDGESVGTSSYFFKVSDEKVVRRSGENYFLWVVVILLIALVFFIIFYLRQRDKVFLELSRQYRREVMKQKRGKPKDIKKRLVVVKKIYRNRVRDVKKLRKGKKGSEVNRKLAGWRKEGYNVDEFFVGQGKGAKIDVEKMKRRGYKL